MAKPDGVIYLLKDVHLDNTYEHTIKFKNQAEQITYFTSKIKYTYQYTSYIRKKETLRVDYLLDDIDDVNYVMYRASDKSRWYFSFVTQKVYKSERCTELVVDLDVMQTYQFDYNLKPSFVERCHMDRWGTDKFPIFSLTDEELDIGKEYETEVAYNIKRNDNVLWFLVLMTNSKDFHEGIGTPSKLNNIPTPYMTYLVPHYLGGNKDFVLSGDGGVSGQPISSLTDLMKFMGDSAIGKAIKEISYIPYLPFNIECNSVDNQMWANIMSEGLNFNVDVIEPSESWLDSLLGGSNTPNLRLARLQGVSNYKDTVMLVDFNKYQGIDKMSEGSLQAIINNPNNSAFDYRIESKLLTHPYRYSILTNWKQEPVIVKNEYLPDNVKVKMSKALSFNNPARYWIEDYKNDMNGRGDCLVENSTIELPIISDAYYEYQLQNKTQLNTQLVTNTATNVVGGAVTGGGVGAGLGAINAGTMVAEQLAKSKDLKNLPDSVVNSTDGSLSIADKNIYLSFYRYKISDDYLKRIGYYFHMYGYKVNSMMELESAINSRNRFNYVKTISANITGNFDYEDLTKIKNNFNKGITFWHYYEGFRYLDYSYNNVEKKLL